jgi:hypothetical protein
MEHKGIEYKIVQTANPTGWKWIVLVDEARRKTGLAHSRIEAVISAERAIDRLPKRSDKSM